MSRTNRSGVRRERDDYILCPYYRCEYHGEAWSTSCTGLADKATTRLIFRCGADLREHKERYCKGQWEDCPLAKALAELHK